MTTDPHPALADLTTLTRIRVETALSRFPTHRLAKRADLSIDLGDGTTDFQWKVSYNSQYGQPGPLAYKVDTLVVNRRIDEAPRPLPEVIRLGSLREINRELALAEEDTQTVKKALLQNASAFISARIRFKPRNSRDGKERWREVHYTRYSVLFNGETLPDGRTADAVYIVLNPPHRKLLDDAEVRPLDYGYLTRLSPGPQRLYELLSFQIYGAIASGRGRAKLLYSEYCMCAPQARYYEFDQVKKQMYKLHVPHRESQYIIQIDYEHTLDRDGQPDWIIYYTPGSRAYAEYQAFANRRLRPAAAQPASDQISPAPPAVPVQTSLELGQTENPLVAELTRRGITPKKAQSILANAKPDQQIIDQLEYLDHVIQQAPATKFHNPPGFYVRFLEDNCPVPEAFWTTRKRRLYEEAQQAKNDELARMYEKEIAYEEFQRQQIDAFIANLPPSEYKQLFAEQRTVLKRKYPNMTDAQLHDLSTASLRTDLKRSGKIALLSFAEFSSKGLNP